MFLISFRHGRLSCKTGSFVVTDRYDEVLGFFSSLEFALKAYPDAHLDLSQSVECEHCDNHLTPQKWTPQSCGNCGSDANRVAPDVFTSYCPKCVAHGVCD